MTAPVQLIVGLGNPGAAYQKTRHNAGAWFLENLALTHQLTLKPDRKFHGALGTLSLEGKRCYLLIPSTFMNHSGEAVRAVAHFYQIPIQAILVAHDELDLPVGTTRLKFDGGHGGHNGLRNIIQHLGTAQFSRLRIGIGHPGHRDQVHDYVLHPPSLADKQKITEACQQAEFLVADLLAGQWQKAIQQLHSLPT